MDEQAQKFLLLESEQAWKQVFNTEKRRLKLVVAIYVALAVPVTANLSVLTWAAVQLDAAVAATALTLFAISAAVSFLRMLVAERAVNVRYRRKINLIRGLFLGESADERIIGYLTKHKDLGILTAQDPQPHALGSTLTAILWPLVVSITVAAGSLVAVWLAALR